jgi:hypothetical protein
MMFKQANLHHRVLDNRTPQNTRPASYKPALVSLSILKNLETLITPLIPTNFVSSVILRTRLTQQNSNHFLGFRCGMRPWLCRRNAGGNFGWGFDYPRPVLFIA